MKMQKDKSRLAQKDKFKFTVLLEPAMGERFQAECQAQNRTMINMTELIFMQYFSWVDRVRPTQQAAEESIPFFPDAPSAAQPRTAGQTS